jgi:hypothetical protein
MDFAFQTFSRGLYARGHPVYLGGKGRRQEEKGGNWEGRGERVKYGRRWNGWSLMHKVLLASKYLDVPKNFL